MRCGHVVGLLFAGVLGACGRGSHAPAVGRDAGAPASAKGSASAASSKPLPQPVSLRGQAIALSVDEATLFVADEDHEALFLLPRAMTDARGARVIALPGPPAQIVALADRVYVTVRTLPTDAARAARLRIHGSLPDPGKISVAAPPKPSATRKRNTPPAPFDPSAVRESQGGLLLALAPDVAAGWVEVGRTVLPPDAWGLAVSADQSHAWVSSAWSAAVSVIELGSMKLEATIATAREPRGIALLPDGKTAFVSHLVGAGLTRVELAGGALHTSPQPLPAAPERAASGVELLASLGYDLLLSPDEQSLFAPRHALGAEGVASWWGEPAVDVLDIASGKPLMPPRAARSPSARIVAEGLRPSTGWEAHAGEAPSAQQELTQPRALVYRKKSDTLLIAGEGFDMLTELDALAADPAQAMIRVHELGAGYDTFGGFPERGGAPTGIVLSRDEHFAYVWCRTTFDVVRVDLDKGEKQYAHLAEDALPADAAYGRRLFSNASNSVLSGGLACGACHPEGRDDGYVWREGNLGVFDKAARFVARRSNLKFPEAAPEPLPELYPRQTPMLAGRVSTNGPFGWHGEEHDITDRMLAGFALHRGAWDNTSTSRDAGQDVAKIDYLADFLRSGLLPPPTLKRELSALEAQGKAVFESNETGCARCHAPSRQFTDRSVVPLRALAAHGDFAREPKTTFKTPSLWFVAGTAPYLHDGSAATLEELLLSNADRMGNTKQLSNEDRTALAAYLRVL